MCARNMVNLILGLSLSFNCFCSLPFWNYEHYEKAMIRILTMYKIGQDNHSILLNNGVYYLQNFVSLDDVKLIPNLKQNEVDTILGKKNFWAEKLNRDLQMPYADQEFLIHLNQCQKDINEFLDYINTLASSETYSIYLYGSMAKGRFGGNSSIDLYVQTDDQNLIKNLEGSRFIKANSSGNTVELLTSSFGEKYLLAPTIRVSSADLFNIQKTYGRILSRLGFYLNFEIGNQLLNRRKGTQRYQLEFNPIEDRIYYLINKTLRLLNYLKVNVSSTGSNSPSVRETVGLIEDFSEVSNDLDLIINRSSGPRLKRIMEVISPESYARLTNHRALRLKNTTQEWVTKIKLLQNLKRQ